MSALDDRDEALSNLSNLLWLGGGATVVIGTVLAWLVAGAALQPVERLRSAARSYSATDLGGRLVVPETEDELQRLAVTLNEMLDRIQASFERQRTFVDRASHELRTPLANLSLQLDLALRRERSGDELRTALMGAADESRRLGRLASNLLALARTTDGGLPIAPRPTDVDELMRETVQSFSARSASAEVDVRVEAEAMVSAVVDPVRVRQALTNLIDNALGVTPRGGQVMVHSVDSTDGLLLAVSDSGPGFPPELRDTAFEMFVRGRGDLDSSVGAGLGLAIVAAVAEAHGGRAWIGPADGGAIVTMVFPHSDPRL